MSTTYSGPFPTVLPASAAKYEDMTSRFGFYLMVLIAVCSPWGGILRLGFESETTYRGVTTVLAIGLILLSLVTFRLPAAIGSRPRVLFFFVFLLLGTLAGLLQSSSLEETLHGSLNRAGYWLVMVAVMSLHLSKEKGRALVVWFTLSTTAMVIVSLIDYFGIVNVPGFNEIFASFRVDPTKADTQVGRALIGPFLGRGFMAVYLSLAWPLPLMELIHGRLKNPLRVALWAGVLAVLTLAIVLNYSRALYVVVGCVGLYALYTAGLRRSLRILFLVVPLVAVFSVVVAAKFPHEVDVFVARLTSLGAGMKVSGAAWRVGTLSETVSDLLQNPQGMGFTMVVVEGSRLSMHSIFVEHLRPAGVLGFVLVGLFMWPVFRLMTRRRAPPEIMVLCASLLGVLAYGVAHSTQSMLVGWIVIGLLYYLSGQPDAGNPVATARTSPALVPENARRVWTRRR